jgi:hypothetical protein
MGGARACVPRGPRSVIAAFVHLHFPRVPWVKMNDLFEPNTIWIQKDETMTRKRIDRQTLALPFVGLAGASSGSSQWMIILDTKSGVLYFSRCSIWA